MKSQRKKEIPSSLNSSDLPTNQRKGKGSPLSDYHHVSLPVPKQKEESNRIKELNESTFHMTVRNKVQISRRKLCLLSAGKSKEILLKGYNLFDYIFVEHLLNLLIGSSTPLEVKEEKEKEISLILILLLRVMENPMEEKKDIPKEVKDWITLSRWIPSDRTFGSWRSSLSFDLYFEIRTVPVEQVFERASNGTIRYSSYCKGYGETNTMGRKKRKTPPSPELDGEPVKLEEEGENLPLQLYQFYITFQELDRKYTKTKRKN
jgi:hypothetical protein